MVLSKLLNQVQNYVKHSRAQNKLQNLLSCEGSFSCVTAVPSGGKMATTFLHTVLPNVRVMGTQTEYSHAAQIHFNYHKNGHEALWQRNQKQQRTTDCIYVT